VEVEGEAKGEEEEGREGEYVRVILVDRVARPRGEAQTVSQRRPASHAEQSLAGRARAVLAMSMGKAKEEEGQEETDGEAVWECLNLFRHERSYRRRDLIRSGFFRKLMAGDFSSANQLQISIRDGCTNADAMAAALDYLEAKQLLTGDFDSFQVFVASRLLIIPDLSQQAAQEIASCLGAANILRAMHHAREYHSVELQRVCLEFLLDYLSTAANVVQGMLVDSSAHQELLAQLRNLPHDSFRELVVSRRKRVERYYHPLPAYKMCVIRRTKSPEKSWAVYKLYEEHTMEFQLSAARDLKTGDIVVTTDENLSQTPRGIHSDHVVAVLHSNTFETHFTLFDNGINNSRLLLNLPGCQRRELGSIQYDSSLLHHGPRSILCVFAEFPCSQSAADDFVGEEEGESAGDDSPPPPSHHDKTRWGRPEGFLQKQLHATTVNEGVVKLHNLAPKWNEKTGAYSLDFYKRVRLPSKKNFILVPCDNEEDVVCIFGKVRKDTYALDFKPPLSMLQAFLAALSSFEHRMGLT